jgi:membrane-bound lytic murein transglycosylase A
MVPFSLPLLARSCRSAALMMAAGMLLAACSQIGSLGKKPEEEKKEPAAAAVSLAPASFSELPGWAQDNHGEALSVFLRSCERLNRLSPADTVGKGEIARPASEWQQICREAASVSTASARQFFETRFQPFAVSDGSSREGLFTGYYEPLVKGSLSPSAAFPMPLYKMPGDIMVIDLGLFREEWKGTQILGRLEGDKFLPYYDRRQIDEGKALAGKGLEIAWVPDVKDSFFMQIQGSGALQLPDGRIQRVGYAGKNGRPYVAIGKFLIESGALTKETVSLQSIRAWMEANPSQANELMYKNPSYVFFTLNDRDGPVGAQGVVLTEGRSLAVDRNLFAYGIPLYLDATQPDEMGQQAIPFRRLMIAQDTGGAILGAVRGDVFFGHGDRAEWLAGNMKARGRYFALLPKTR